MISVEGQRRRVALTSEQRDKANAMTLTHKNKRAETFISHSFLSVHKRLAQTKVRIGWIPNLVKTLGSREMLQSLVNG